MAIAFGFSNFGIISCLIAGVGNAMFHVGGGIDVLNISDKKVHFQGFSFQLLKYKGNNYGTVVKSLIQCAQARVSHYEEIIITYTSDTNQTTTVNVSTDNSQEITNLINEIGGSKKYKVEIQCDKDICNIIITTNN